MSLYVEQKNSQTHRYAVERLASSLQPRSLLRAHHLVPSRCRTLVALLLLRPDRRRRYILHLDEFLHCEDLSGDVWRVRVVDCLVALVQTESNEGALNPVSEAPR